MTLQSYFSRLRKEYEERLQSLEKMDRTELCTECGEVTTHHETEEDMLVCVKCGTVKEKSDGQE